MILSPRSWVLIAAGSLLFLAGLGTGYKLYRPGRVAPEGPAFEQKVPGGKILERDPDRKVAPPPVIPKGAKIDRQVQLTVEPTTEAPVDLTLTLLTLKDGSRRAEVTTPNGTILKGVDIPVPNRAAREPLRWAVGGIYGPNSYGIFVDRDFGPFRTGVEVTRNRAGPAGVPASVDWRVRIGIVF